MLWKGSERRIGKVRLVKESRFGKIVVMIFIFVVLFFVRWRAQFLTKTDEETHIFPLLFQHHCNAGLGGRGREQLAKVSVPYYLLILPDTTQPKFSE